MVPLVLALSTKPLSARQENAIRLHPLVLLPMAGIPILWLVWLKWALLNQTIAFQLGNTHIRFNQPDTE